jgi:cell division inhibitor SulA
MALAEVTAEAQALPPTPHPGLQEVLRSPAIWRGRALAQEQQRQADKSIATGFATLDASLPDGGWPLGALTELLVNATGVGELSLLLPALRSICAQGRGIALLAPPWLPQARAWQSTGLPLERLLLLDVSGIDLLWSAEQILRSGECGAVVLWGQAAGRALDQRALQRLQLAAGNGNALCFLYRTLGAEANPSPAPLRLKLDAYEGGLRIHCIKQRGTFRTRPLPLQLFPAHWQAPCSPALLRPHAV